MISLWVSGSQERWAVGCRDKQTREGGVDIEEGKLHHGRSTDDCSTTGLTDFSVCYRIIRALIYVTHS